MVQGSPGRFDLILIGQLLPLTAPLELATALHEIAPGVPVLLATASADQFAANSLIEAGISDVVPWPIIAAEVATAVTDCLWRKQPKAARSPGVALGA
jgi:DNA-binding NtrC family response regulator